MIRDRGNKKWTSLILPEHREALEKWYAEEIHERPELDEQQAEEINRTLTEVFRTGKRVVIRYWNDGEREVVGRIARYELGKVRLDSGEGGTVHIDADKIIGVEHADECV